MDKETIKTYNCIATQYDHETANFWNRFPRTILDTFADLVTGNVLDVGSGPGRDALLLKDYNLKVTCLDASDAMIELCLGRGLDAKVGDFTHMPFSDNYFDGVWAYTSLQHVPKSQIFTPIKEVRRVLKDKGIFGLGLIEGTTEGYKIDADLNNQRRWFSYYTKLEVEILLETNGFEVIYFEYFRPRSKNYLNFIARKA